MTRRVAGILPAASSAALTCAQGLRTLVAHFRRPIVAYCTVMRWWGHLTGRTHGRTILFVPEKPIHRYIIWKIARLLGLRVTSNTRTRYDLAILWEDSTYVTHENQLLAGSLPKLTLNRTLHDISKRNVDRHFAEIFGYSLMIDPTAFHGQCVMKSDRNAKHDGRIIDCPVPNPDDEFVYQRLIDNRCDPGAVVDLRVLIVNQSIPFVYKKYRPLSTRFSNRNTRVEICTSNEVFSSVELGQLRTLARSIGLDVGELDVLRDAESQKIYVVDVNNTPFGPPNHLPFREQARAVRTLAKAFEQEILRACEMSRWRADLPPGQPVVNTSRESGS